MPDNLWLATLRVRTCTCLGNYFGDNDFIPVFFLVLRPGLIMRFYVLGGHACCDIATLVFFSLTVISRSAGRKVVCPQKICSSKVGSPVSGVPEPRAAPLSHGTASPAGRPMARLPLATQALRIASVTALGAEEEAGTDRGAWPHEPPRNSSSSASGSSRGFGQSSLLCPLPSLLFDRRTAIPIDGLIDNVFPGRIWFCKTKATYGSATFLFSVSASLRNHQYSNATAISYLVNSVQESLQLCTNNPSYLYGNHGTGRPKPSEYNPWCLSLDGLSFVSTQWDYCASCGLRPVTWLRRRDHP